VLDLKKKIINVKYGTTTTTTTTTTKPLSQFKKMLKIKKNFYSWIMI